MADCECGMTLAYSSKGGARRMLARGACRHCSRRYRPTKSDVFIYVNADGKWCSTCSGCGAEQAYTRKDHAKQSESSDWQCKKCVAAAKAFSNNLPVGDERRIYNRLKKSAASRGIEWCLSFEEFAGSFHGMCSLTGWAITMSRKCETASLDRIDSGKGYTPDNVQWVHKMVNMCKNKYSLESFVGMCKAVADKEKW